MQAEATVLNFCRSTVRPVCLERMLFGPRNLDAGNGLGNGFDFRGYRLWLLT